MRARLAQSDVTNALARLRVVFPSTNADAAPGAISGAYFLALNDLSLEELNAAVEAAIKSEKKFMPRPARIRELALEFRRERNAPTGPVPGSFDAWLRDGMAQGKPCPACGAVLACLECGKPECHGADGGRLGVRHDPLKHREAQVPIVGAVAR